MPKNDFIYRANLIDDMLEEVYFMLQPWYIAQRCTWNVVKDTVYTGPTQLTFSARNTVITMNMIRNQS